MAFRPLGDRVLVRRGPQGTGVREKYSAAAVRAPSANAHTAFTTDSVAASSGPVTGATSVAISTA